MVINEIEKIVSEYYTNQEDEQKVVEYKEAINNYLTNNKFDDEIIKVIISGMSIDGGVVFLENIQSVQEKKVIEIWNIIKKNEKFTGKNSIEAFRIIVMLLTASLNNTGKVSIIEDDLIIAIVDNVMGENSYLSYDECKKILIEELLSMLEKKIEFKPFENRKLSAKYILDFVSLLQECITSEKLSDIGIQFIQWLNKGKLYAEKELEKQRIEANIPKSKIDELKRIVRHYEEVENKLKKDAYTIAGLEKKINVLMMEISNLKDENKLLEIEICSLNKKLSIEKQNLDTAGKEIEERKAINNAFDALKKTDEDALLKDIAGELKSIYDDFNNSKNDKMDVELGEIYRDNMKKMFKILDKKGIKV